MAEDEQSHPRPRFNKLSLCLPRLSLPAPSLNTLISISLYSFPHTKRHGGVNRHHHLRHLPLRQDVITTKAGLLSLPPPLSGSLCIARTLSLAAVSKQATTSPRKPQKLSPEMQPLSAWEKLSRNLCSQFHFLRALTQRYGCLWLVSLLNLAWCFLQTQRSWE